MREHQIIYAKVDPVMVNVRVTQTVTHATMPAAPGMFLLMTYLGYSDIIYD